MKLTAIVAIILIGLGVGFGASAQTVNRWVDEDGVTHYSDQQPVAGEAEEIKVPDAGVTEFEASKANERIQKQLQQIEQDRKTREAETAQKKKARALEEALEREPLVVEEKKKKDKKGSRNKYQGPYPKPITERLPKPPGVDLQR